MSTIERVSVPVPSSFDQRKVGALTAKVCEAKGDGWVFESYSPETGKVTFTREASMLEVHEATIDEGPIAKRLRLPTGTKVADGDKIAARMADANPGYTMVKFDPHLGEAYLAQLSDAEARCRSAVAVALSVKPWEVMVRSQGEGFELGLPRTYQASRHDSKLQEVVDTVVGRPGWRVDVNQKTLMCRFIPGDPPIFPAVVPYPLRDLGTPRSGPMASLLGYRLPLQGEGLGEPISIDWKAQAFVLLAGMPGAGKTVSLNSLLAQQIAAGAETFVVDDRAKSLDFLWAKDLLMPGGWGCDSEAHAAATLGLVYELGQQRAQQMAELGYVNWLDMPDHVRFRPMFGIVDEAAALLVQDPVPKGLPKDHPIVDEINQLNYQRALIGRYMNKIIAELRFVGVRLVVSNQVTNQATGLPPSVKSKIGHRILQGTNPSKSARMQTFNDEQSVPSVPEHVKASGANARGVGLCDLEGQAPAVFKSLYTTTDEYRARLAELRVPQLGSAPTSAQISRFVPSLIEDAEAAGEQPTAKHPRVAAWETDDFGDRLTGMERANAARHAAAVAGGGGRPTKADREESALAARSGQVSVSVAETCQSCGGFVRPDGRCGCSS